MATIDSTTSSTSMAYAGQTRLNALDWVSLVLMIVGGLNWGLVGAFNFDLVAAIFGPMSALSRIVYILVGLAALYGIAFLVRLAKR